MNTNTQTGFKQPQTGLERTQTDSIQEYSNTYPKLLQTLPPEMQTTLMAALTQLPDGLGSHSLDAVVHGRVNSLAKSLSISRKNAYEQFSQNLKAIALTYFGAANTLDAVISECFASMEAAFSQIGLCELRDAHRFAAKTGKYQAFNGMYTVNLFHEIMNEWRYKRQALLHAYDSTMAKQIQVEAEETERKRERFKAQTIDWFETEKAAMNIKTWEDVPIYYANVLVEAGLTGSKDGELWKQAGLAAERQMKREAEGYKEKGRYEKAKELMKLFEKRDKSLHDRAVDNYKKMLVFKAIKG